MSDWSDHFYWSLFHFRTQDLVHVKKELKIDAFSVFWKMIPNRFFFLIEITLLTQTYLRDEL